MIGDDSAMDGFSGRNDGVPCESCAKRTCGCVDVGRPITESA